MAPSLVWMPPTTANGGCVEVRQEAIVYEFEPGIAKAVIPEHRAALLATLQTVAGNLTSPTPTIANAGSMTSPVPTLGTGGAAGTTSYSYAVVASNAQGDANQSTAATIATGNAVLNGTNFNTITWTAVAGATQYKIIRTASAGTPATTGLIATIAAGTLTTNDTGLAASAYTAQTNSQTQTYQVVASNANGDTLPSANATTAVGNTSLSATNFNALSWGVTAGASQFKVIRTVGGPSQGIIATVSSATTTINDTGLAASAYTAAGAAVGNSVVLAGPVEE